MMLGDVYVINRDFREGDRDQLIVNSLVKTLGNNPGCHTIMGIQGCNSPNSVEQFD